MTHEDFIRWYDDAVTRWVFAAIDKAALENKETWVEQSWVNNNSNPALLTELRTRADAYRALIDTSYEGWCATHGEDPVYEERKRA